MAREYYTPKKSNVQNNLYSGNMSVVPSSLDKAAQGYSLTTTYSHPANLTSRGYPSSRDPMVGSTGSKLTTAASSGGNNGVRSISGSTGGGGGHSGGGGGESYSGGGGGDNGLGALASLLAAYQNNYNNYLAEMRAAAQQAYNRSMASLNDAYNSQMSSLADNMNSSKGQLLDSYNRSKKSINDDSESSLRQAYINKMLSERNLGQMMSAQGLSGGATETSMANMLNNYGNARNAINTTTNKNLSDLEGNYNDSIAQIMQAYNSAVANANAQKTQQVMALENALASNEMSALSDYHSLMQSQNRDYLDLLKTAIANGSKFSYTPSQANNAVKTANVIQASQPIGSTNYAALQALQNAQQAPGAAVSLVNSPTAQNNYLAAILSQLGR